MSIIGNIKKGLLNRKAKIIHAGQQRTVRLIEFNQVKTVGILFNASDENKYNRAAHLVRHLRTLKKDVRAIGYVQMSELPHYADVTISLNYIKRKEVNWYGLPINKFSSEFINSEFDLLIDLDFINNPTLKYLANTSMAHCKVGLKQDNNSSIYDFMLEGIDPENINLFLKELLHYLEMVKTQ